MDRRRKIEVQILNKPYTVLSDGANKVEELAAFVDERIREAIEFGHAQSPERAAVLAALNIAEALFRARDNLDDFARQIESRSEALLKKIPE